MPQDISKSLGHNLRELPSIAKAVTKSICRHPLYISYLIFFSPYILKLIYFLSPLLILLLATALCAFIATASTNNSFLLLSDKGQENASGTLLEAEAYKIIFDTFHDSLITLADESDEVEASELIKTEASMPEIVKSCCSSSPLHQIAAETTICDKVELPCSAENPRKSTNCDETEIIKHMVCSTINKPDEQLLKSAVGVEIDQAEEPPTTMKTQKSGSNAAIADIQPPNSAVLRQKSFFKTSSKSYDFSSIGSLRREKEWTRTLACKLFEERHNSGAGREGEYGMDMLWETYESIDSPDDDQRRTMSRRSSRDDTFRVSVDEEDDGDGDADVASEKMCCLQALKMSSGKVNLGIGRKNMMKFSKALRRFGWLHKTKPTSMPRLEINTLE